MGHQNIWRWLLLAVLVLPACDRVSGGLLYPKWPNRGGFAITVFTENETRETNGSQVHHFTGSRRVVYEGRFSKRGKDTLELQMAPVWLTEYTGMDTLGQTPKYDWQTSEVAAHHAPVTVLLSKQGKWIGIDQQPLQWHQSQALHTKKQPGLKDVLATLIDTVTIRQLMNQSFNYAFEPLSPDSVWQKDTLFTGNGAATFAGHYELLLTADETKPKIAFTEAIGGSKNTTPLIGTEIAGKQNSKASGYIWLNPKNGMPDSITRTETQEKRVQLMGLKIMIETTSKRWIGWEMIPY